MKTKEEILDKAHWSFVVEAGMSSIHNETFPLAYKGQAIIAMDVYYNQAIDEAIGVVKRYGTDHWKLIEPDLMAEDLQKQLELLKKKS